MDAIVLLKLYEDRFELRDDLCREVVTEIRSVGNHCNDKLVSRKLSVRCTSVALWKSTLDTSYRRLATNLGLTLQTGPTEKTLLVVKLRSFEEAVEVVW